MEGLNFSVHVSEPEVAISSVEDTVNKETGRTRAPVET